MTGLRTTMKKILYFLPFLIFIISLSVFAACAADNSDLPTNNGSGEIVNPNPGDSNDDETDIYTLTYSATVGGMIEGKTVQTVKLGEYGTKVLAVPDDGYNFSGWSDGYPYAERQDKGFTSEINVTAEFEQQVFVVRYFAGEGGTISGETVQYVKYGESTTPVTAIPDEGYRFVGWNDSCKQPQMVSNNVVANSDKTAYFEWIENTYMLNYNNNDGDSAAEITLSYGKIDNVKLPVPTKQYYNFKGWYIGDLQVTDIDGNIIAGNKLFDYDKGIIYAKWEADLQYNAMFTCKVLLVYVTEINGTFKEHGGSRDIYVNYKMSETERQVCQNFTVKMREAMKDILGGLVTFQIDEYFTTRSLGREDFYSDPLCYYLIADEIPEIKEKKEQGLLEEYRSSIAVVTMHDYDEGDPFYKGRLNKCASTVCDNFGTIYLDSVFRSTLIYEGSWESYRDLTFKGWDWYHHENLFSLSDPVYFGLHTLITTFDGCNKYDEPESCNFYKVMSYYDEYYNHLNHEDRYEIMKLYLLDDVYIDGKKVKGIPFEFWIQNGGTAM